MEKKFRLRLTQRTVGQTDSGGTSVAGRFDLVVRARGYARIALASIRLFNGTAALFAPTTLARRLGVDPEANPALVFRLRTS